MVNVKKILTGFLGLSVILGLFLGGMEVSAIEEDTFVFQESWLEGAPPRFANKKEIKVAVVQDGPSPLYDKLLKEIESQTERLLQDEKKVTFVKKGFNANWNPKVIIGLLGRALTDPDIDLIITIGLLSTQAASNPAIFLSKPVVGTLITRSETLTWPISSDGTSEKTNFTFVVLNLPISRDFEVFHEMINFERVDILVDGLIYSYLKGIQGKKSELEKELGIQINIIQGGTTAEGFLKQLGSETQAVMLSTLPRMSQAQRQALIEGIKRMQIPSYSFVGYTDVEEGDLVSNQTLRVIDEMISHLLSLFIDHF